VVSEAIAKERTFRGKVIDFDTKKPLEGVAVVAYWVNLQGAPFIKDVKEALTDNNGEWSIVGEEGDGPRQHPSPSFTQRISDDILQPQFMMLKPGYEAFQINRGIYWSLVAYPHNDRTQGLEGIILSIEEKEERAIREFYHKAPQTYGLPFLPMKDPEKKLRNLEIPLDYPRDVKRLNLRETGFLNLYTLMGLKRDPKGRGIVMMTPIIDYDDDDPVRQKEMQKEMLRKQRNFLRLSEQENRNLGLDFYKYYKRILEE
jgi:hypothetical protein